MRYVPIAIYNGKVSAIYKQDKKKKSRVGISISKY